MRTIIAAAAFIALTGPASADTYVRGYYRDNGTYVQPHHQTAPNNTLLDNYGTRGNYNPYTGQAGTVDPYRSNSSGFGSGSGNSGYGVNDLRGR